jgi:hypothetical protein
VTRRLVASLIWLLLIVLHAPTQAQAVVWSLFPDFLGLSATEPAMLVLTGAALLVLAKVGVPRRR